MSNKNITIILTILLITLFGLTGAQASHATARVDCKEISRLNNQVQYQYQVTLENNTASKLLVNYNVIFMAGQVPRKNHRHSTLMIPHETLTETHEGVMSVTGWDKVTGFRVEWSSQRQ